MVPSASQLACLVSDPLSLVSSACTGAGRLTPDVSSPMLLSGCPRWNLGAILQRHLKLCCWTWGALEGQVTYPPFVNSKAVLTVPDPDGQPLLRSHDTQQLKETIRRCRQRFRQPSMSVRLHATGRAYKCHARCSVPRAGSQSYMTQTSPWC